MKHSMEQISRAIGDTEFIICSIQGDIFSAAYRLGISPASFAEKYMVSSAAAIFDRNPEYFDTAEYDEGFIKAFIIAVLSASGDSLENYPPIDKINGHEEEYAYFLGFIYRCEQILRCISSKAVYDIFPEEFMRISYDKITESCDIRLPQDMAEICRRLDILQSA